MFRIVSITGFIVVFMGIALHCIACRPRFDDLFGKERRLRALDGLRVLVYLLTLLFLKQKLNLIGVLRKLVYLLTLFCFVVLVVTGFYRPLVLDEPISGYLMMLHATFAPVFAACLAVLAVMWAHNCRFNESDWPWLLRIIRLVRQEPANQESPAEKSELGQKICFWLIMLLALPLVLSVVLSMFRFFGTQWQEFLLNLHRYTALLLVLVAIVHTYLIIRAKMSKQ